MLIAGVSWAAIPQNVKTARGAPLVMGGSPMQMQTQHPTRNAADAVLDNFIQTCLRNFAEYCPGEILNYP